MASLNSTFYKAIAEIQARARELYPLTPYFKEGFLKVDDVHTIWWGINGNPKGKPVLNCHGGPGSSCSMSPNMTQTMNPEKYMIISVDQRGSGNSTPHACVENNTTWHLVDDFVKVLDHLGLEKVMVYGGSWGSTIALALAISHPNRVTELVLRGIFTLRACELKYFYQEGVSLIYPEAWEEYKKPIPEAERGDFIAAYHKRLFGDDEKERLACARAWSVWEGSTSLAVPKLADKFSEEKFALQFARIENHYFFNKGFWGDNENWIFDNAYKLKDIPIFAVHGRYDCVCPYDTFYQLKKATTQEGSAPREFVTCPLSGHSANDPDIMSNLIIACDNFAKNFTPAE